MLEKSGWVVDRWVEKEIELENLSSKALGDEIHAKAHIITLLRGGSDGLKREWLDLINFHVEPPEGSSGGLLSFL